MPAFSLEESPQNRCICCALEPGVSVVLSDVSRPGPRNVRPLVPSLFECAFKPAIKPTSSLPLPEKDEASLAGPEKDEASLAGLTRSGPKRMRPHSASLAAALHPLGSEFESERA